MLKSHSMPHKILNEDWSDYDNRKIRDRWDAKDFSCTETWEVNYLVEKIRKVYPFYIDQNIRSAIVNCCAALGSPHPRKPFVECVMKRLRGW